MTACPVAAVRSYAKLVRTCGGVGAARRYWGASKEPCHAKLAMITLVLLATPGAGPWAGAEHGPDRPGSGAALTRPGSQVIARVRHGKTPRARADEHGRYLSGATAKFPSISGNLGYQMMRIDGGPDGDAYTEFQVISHWESLDAIRAYAGEDIRRSHDLPRDHGFLVDMEPCVRNHQLRISAVRP